MTQKHKLNRITTLLLELTDIIQNNSPISYIYKAALERIKKELEELIQE